MTPSMVIERIYKAPLEELWALWTTKPGFESWWGPQGFRADVHAIEACAGGVLDYDMVADTPEMVAAMQRMGEPSSTRCRGRFSVFQPHRRLVLLQVIDFLPGVPAYESRIEVNFHADAAGHARMVVALSEMHDAQTTAMQQQGFTSQLGKLDTRYGWRASQA